MFRKANRFFSAVPVFFSVLCCAVLACILGLLVLGQGTLQSYYAGLSPLSNLALFPFALAAAAALLWLRARSGDRLESQSSLWRLRALFAGVLAVQLIVARCCWYKMGWDISVVYTTAEELARGEALSNPDYFRLCPNNAPLTLLQALPMWVAVRLGLAVPFVVLPYLDAVLLNLSAYFTVRCTQALTRSRTAFRAALTVSIGWIALSPYLLYPYTDVFSILFPVLALYVYLRVQRPVLKWFLVSLLCFFGASIKPTVLILLIALALLGLCRLLAGHGAGWKQTLLILLAVLAGMLPGKLWQDASTAYLAGSAVPEEQLSETHYLMLGMNGETYGGHSPDDVAFSQSYASLSERRSANLSRAWERVKERGFIGNVQFFAVKAYKAYVDGSFASHTSFLELEVPKRTDALSTFLRSLYHKRGVLMPACQAVAQWLWLTLLTLCAAAALRGRRDPAVALLSLTLLGATAYLLLFEVWPRYLFLYAPFFVILASVALDQPTLVKRRSTCI